MPQPARLRLFGIPALVNGGDQPFKLRTAKQLGALVYLVLEGREQAVSRDRLVDLLWDDVPADRGRHSLAQACSAIRAALGPGALERTGTALRLVAPLVTDLDRITDEFDRLPLAEPLLEAEWWAGPDFGHWVDGARGRLRRAAEDALRKAIADFRGSGETGRVHATAAVLYKLDPLSDVAVHALAERELIAGDVVAAIRLLRAHQARVREALGCTPHKDVERLLRRLEAGSHPPIERVPARLAAEAPALRPSVFVGREKELAHLEAEWQRASESGFRSCLVLGPGGIGKSSLVRRFAATVAARAQPVFLVTCQEIGEGIPFAALSDLITAMSRDPSVSATDPRWLAEVARIHPALRTQYPGIPEAPEAPPESIRLRVAEGVLQMLDAVADGGPVGIVFDDLPFMDPASRDVMHVLTRRLEHARRLVVATARTPALLEGATPGFPGMSSVTWSTTERLSPLDGQCTRQLASALSPGLTGQRRVLERIEAIADGNPHFTEMLVADWERYATTSLAGGLSVTLPEDWQPPDSLRQAFAMTYAGVSPDAQEILHVLAVAGRSLHLEELPNLLREMGKSIDSPILDLLLRGILRLDDGSLSFKNELHRAFAYYAITGDLRRFYHGRLGKKLLESPDYVGKLEAGRHLCKAGLHADAANEVAKAVPIAIERGGAAEAENALRIVLQGVRAAPVRWHLQLLLASAEAAQGHYSDGLRVLDEMDPTMEADRDDAALAAVLRAQALQRTLLGDDEGIKKAVEDAVHRAADSGEHLQATAAQIAAEAASEMDIPEMLEQAVQLSAQLASKSLSDATRARALLTSGFSLLMSGDFPSALATLTESAALLYATRSEAELSRALNGRALSLVYLGRHKEAMAPLQEALQIATKLSDSTHRLALISNLGVAYEDIGMLQEAEHCYMMAVDGLSGSQPRAVILGNLNLANMALIRGNLEAAAESLQIAKRAVGECRSWRWSALVDFSQADLLLALGEPERAWPIVLQASTSTWGRERSIDTNGKMMRLTLHCGLATGGPSRLATLVDELEKRRPPVRLFDAVEISGFLAWAVRQNALDPAIADRGGLVLEPDRVLAGFSREPGRLLGPIAALAAVGIYPEERWVRKQGESALDMVERVCPRAERGELLPCPEALIP